MTDNTNNQMNILNLPNLPNKVWKLFDSPDKWCKRHWAKNSHGFTCSLYSKHATCWCLGAAIRLIYSTIECEHIWGRVQRYLIDQLGREPFISGYNDCPTTKFEDIVRLCKELDI